MDLIKTVLRLDFESASRPWLEIREIVRVAGGDPTAELQAAPIVVDRPNERKRIVAQVRAVTIEHEMPESKEASISDALEMMTKFNEASEFPSISQIRHDVIFIEPFALPFLELVSFLKKHYLKDSALSTIATDIGLLFDQHEEGFLRHIQVGPMDATQLRSQYLRWPPDNLPNTFVFITLGYELTRETQFSSAFLKEFLVTAMDWEADEAENIIRELKAEDRP